MPCSAGAGCKIVSFTPVQLHVSLVAGLQIVRGSFPPPPATFSKGLRDLVEIMLRVDVKRRPTVNDVLKTSIMKERIEKFLTATVR